VWSLHTTKASNSTQFKYAVAAVEQVNDGTARSVNVSNKVQGGPAKVGPTYIFACNIILVKFECIGKIQCFLVNVITV